MSNIIRPSSIFSARIIHNRHFWIILALTCAIALLYYSRIILDYRPYWLWRIEVFEYNNNFFGSIFIISLIYTAVVFWWRGLLIMWLVSISFIIPVFIHYKATPVDMLVNILYLGIPLILVGYINIQLTWRNKEQRLWLDIERERQLYVAEVLKAHEEERKFIARELHDDTIQSLLAMVNTSQLIIKNAPNNNSGQIIDLASTVRDEILRITNDLKKLTLDLRPAVLDNVGFIQALRLLVQRFNQEGLVDTNLIVRGKEQDLPSGTDVVMYRVVQEALNNIRYHSKASKATITIEYQSKMIRLSINDNGVGFEVPERINSLVFKNHLGLIGMQERVHSTGGRFNVQSKAGKGTKISVEFIKEACPSVS